MILEARGLAIGYRRDRIVGRDIDAAVEAGEVRALLGPNGGGKTTLLKTSLGLIPPLAGEVRLDRRRLAAFSPFPARSGHRLRSAGPCWHLRLSRRRDHADGARGPCRTAWPPVPHGREIVHAALERLGISHLAARTYTLISGGERQLALIARALTQEPRLFVLDEPTASLDFGNQGKVMRAIRSLADMNGLGVLSTTHDPNHALRTGRC